MMTESNGPPLGLDRFQADFSAWADATFPKSTVQTRARHLFREAIELVCAAHPDSDNEALATELAADLRREFAKVREQGTGDLGAESADCFLLLLHLAQGANFSLLAAAHTKYAEVRQRVWGEPDAAGVTEHLRE
jgi:hypothetical protein